MYLQIFIFLTAIATGFTQFYPSGGVPYGMGQPMGGVPQSPRGMGDYYQMAGYPSAGGYQMPPRYVPNFYPPQSHYPNAQMPYVAGPGPEQSPPAYQPSIMPGSENTNENANTNVNINSGSYRRSLHSPSKEHGGASRSSNTNSNINMSS
ncbi:hypothetical protein PV325_003572 [Microctonus aethiopoides]|nr:hypothetical protein PV325_003572 [Microctonus aethiopoides]KAK0095201.1 hypothetical protein PV326_008993 [Microctonus aethiopoides]